jgi:hypothetical protein
MRLTYYCILTANPIATTTKVAVQHKNQQYMQIEVIADYHKLQITAKVLVDATELQRYQLQYRYQQEVRLLQRCSIIRVSHEAAPSAAQLRNTIGIISFSCNSKRIVLQ